MKPDESAEKPLSGMANVLLQAGAGALILLFYGFVFFSILLLLLVLLAELIILIALARFGAARLMTPLVNRHGALTAIFFRSLWLNKSTEFQVPLSPADAPALFTLLGAVCEKAGVRLPREVQLQMGVTAWVRMKGFRKGSGKTILGVGYDLLAGLTQAEIEGVLAHEMMHAKLVQRGFRQLLGKGLSRAIKLANGLTAQVAEDHRAGKSVIFIENFLRVADTLTRMAARQISACSRQDEFEADHGAAELCGAGPLRSSLLKLDGMERVASRIPLRDRIAQLESGESFGEWLVREMAAVNARSEAEIEAGLLNPYSTHPSLHDRLAALTRFPDQTCGPSAPALELLSAPDKVAADLVEMIQKELASQEQQDSKRLNILAKKTRTNRNVGPLAGVGGLLVIVGAGGLLIALGGEMPALAIALCAAAIPLGVTLVVMSRFREKIALPVPAYAQIKAVANEKINVDKERVDSIEKELRASGGQVKAGKRRAAYFVQQGYDALATCDYVRAHIAARFCLEQEKKSIPGHLALAIAGAALNQGQQVGAALRFVRQNTAMKGASTAWGAGWALALIGDWAYAEIFLEQARSAKPAEPTVLSLLAITQNRRGKLFSAISSARKAHELQPADRTYTKLLVDLLLQGGFLREAHEHLQHLAEEAMVDAELTVAMATLCLSQRNFPIAEQWMDVIAQNTGGPEKFVQLGHLCETARHDQRATDFFQHALTHGHFPEAHFGLGRLEAHRENHAQARTHFLAALDLERPVAEKSSTAASLVSPILQRLRQLEKPTLNCRAWIVKLPADTKVKALANVSFIVYAPTDQQAQQTLTFTLGALQPNSPPPTAHWRLAPKQQQPDGPISPGILHFVE